MSLESNLIFLVIFGVSGFVISKFYGINPYRIFTDLGEAFFVILLFIIFLPAISNPENALETIPKILDLFVSNLPGIIIGDAAGSIIAAITGE